MLSDRSIRDRIADRSLVIDPFSDSNVQPASVDLRLGDAFRIPVREMVQALDLTAEIPPYTRAVCAEEFVLHPGEFVLATTLERVWLPDDLAAQVNGKSSHGRVGVVVHATAGFIDPGFRGQITLEMSNVGTIPVVLHHGQRICQLHFVELDRPAQRPYGSPGLGSHYQDQWGAAPARGVGDRSLT